MKNKKPAQVEREVAQNRSVLKEETLSRINKKEVIMGIEKKGDYRYVWGELDLISAGLVTIGVYLIAGNYPIGWVLSILGILKQFSGK